MDYGPLKGLIISIVYLGVYAFKILNAGKITLEEYFTNDYIDEVYESESICTHTKLLCDILDSKY